MILFDARPNDSVQMAAGGSRGLRGRDAAVRHAHHRMRICGSTPMIFSARGPMTRLYDIDVAMAEDFVRDAKFRIVAEPDNVRLGLSTPRAPRLMRSPT